MFRISNGFRVIEDSIGLVAGVAARKVSKTAHDVHIEYRARQLASEAKRLSKQAAKVNDLSYAEKRQMERDNAAIVARTNELLAKR